MPAAAAAAAAKYLHQESQIVDKRNLLVTASHTCAAGCSCNSASPSRHLTALLIMLCAGVVKAATSAHTTEAKAFGIWKTSGGTQFVALLFSCIHMHRK
jgi:hypothetical protein